MPPFYRYGRFIALSAREEEKILHPAFEFIYICFSIAQRNGHSSVFARKSTTIPKGFKIADWNE